MEKKLRTAVLMGGVGGERTVSLKSGRAVAAGLRKAGHHVLPYEVESRSLPGLKDLRPDAAFIALHGPFGEDGGVQQLLEQMGIPYTGSGPRASRWGMNKLVSKRLFIRNSVPVADYFTVTHGESAAQAAAKLEQFGCPVVCKPVSAGSSLGITIVKSPEQLPDALEAAREHSDTTLIERHVRGRELTVGVLEGHALPMVEVISRQGFFDYEAKYDDEHTRYHTPVALLPTVYRRATEAALRAYRALGCRHLARVDMIYGHRGQLAVLEVNTIPGFTPRSLLPMAAAEEGVRFEALCDRLVRAAVRDAAAAARRRRMTA
ncbi:MAG: D-alanine--D-alanine ligase [Candidatus Brocadiia bacterium]